MTPQEEAIALWLYLESRGFKASYRSVGRVLRDHGLHFRQADLYRWLGNQRGNHAEPKNEHVGTSRTQNGSPLLGPLFSPSDSPVTPPYNPPVVSSSSSLRSSSSSTCDGDFAKNDDNERVAKNHEAAEKMRKSLQLRERYDKRNAILAQVWKHVEPIIARSTSWTSWRARNARVADDFVRGGYTPEQMDEAWQLASRLKGEPVRELSQIRRFLEKVHTPRGARR